MASLARTSVLRQATLLSQRCRSTSTAAVRAPSFIRPTTAAISRQPIWTLQTASFSSTARTQILPPGPQVIHGGVNEPAPVPKPSPTHGSYHWTFERLLSVAIVPLTIAPFAAGHVNAAVDAALVFTILLHSHLGFQSCITDYFPTWQHPTLRKSMDWLLNIATLLVGWGFYEFETNDVGLTEGIRRIWRAGAANDATIEAASGLGHDGKLKNVTG